MRLTYTVSVKFYCRESKIGSDGKSPVEMGVNVNGNRFFCNLPHRCEPKSFSRMISSMRRNELVDYLNTLETTIKSFECKLIREGKQVCVNAFKEFVRNGFTSPTENIGYLLDQFHSYINEKGISNGVVRKYELVYESFLEKTNLTREDFIESITKGKIREYAEYLDRTYKPATVSGMLTKLKSIFIFAEDNRLIEKNPFTGYKIKKVDTVVELPSKEDYERIKNVDLSGNKSLERVRDLWLFASGSGLAYCDCARLRPEDFQFKDGHTFINKNRAKTDVEYFAVLLPIAEEMARKYNYSLPIISNQKVNYFLKTIADYAGVNFSLHFHLARHIYCHTLLNQYKMSYQTAAKMLGHKQLKQTMHYGKIWGTTVLEEFDKNRREVA